MLNDVNIKAFYDVIAGRLMDEGWPEPYNVRSDPPYHPYFSICWRRGEKGSALILETRLDGLIPRHAIRLQILVQERFVMIDLKSGLEIWPGEHDALTMIEVLRHFKSAIS